MTKFIERNITTGSLKVLLLAVTLGCKMSTINFCKSIMRNKRNM